MTETQAFEGVRARPPKKSPSRGFFLFPSLTGVCLPRGFVLYGRRPRPSRWLPLCPPLASLLPRSDLDCLLAATVRTSLSRFAGSMHAGSRLRLSFASRALTCVIFEVWRLAIDKQAGDWQAMRRPFDPEICWIYRTRPHRKRNDKHAQNAAKPSLFSQTAVCWRYVKQTTQ